MIYKIRNKLPIWSHCLIISSCLLFVSPVYSFDINPLNWFGVDKQTYEKRLNETLFLFSLPKLKPEELKGFIDSVETDTEFYKRLNNVKPLNSQSKDSWRYVYLKHSGEHGKGGWRYTNNDLMWFGLPDKLVETKVKTAISNLGFFSYRPEPKELIQHYINSLKVFKFDY